MLRCKFLRQLNFTYLEVYFTEIYSSIMVFTITILPIFIDVCKYLYNTYKRIYWTCNSIYTYCICMIILYACVTQLTHQESWNSFQQRYFYYIVHLLMCVCVCSLRYCRGRVGRCRTTNTSSVQIRRSPIDCSCQGCLCGRALRTDRAK